MPVITENGRQRLALWVIFWCFVELICAIVVLVVCLPVLIGCAENPEQSVSPYEMWWPVALMASCVSALSVIPAVALVALTSWRMRLPHRELRRPSAEASQLGAAILIVGSSLHLYVLVETIWHSCSHAKNDAMRKQCMDIDIVNAVSLIMQLVVMVSVRLLQTSTSQAIKDGDLTDPAPGWVLFPPKSALSGSTMAGDEWSPPPRHSSRARLDSPSSSESSRSQDSAVLEPSDHREMLLTRQSRARSTSQSRAQSRALSHRQSQESEQSDAWDEEANRSTEWKLRTEK